MAELPIVILQGPAEEYLTLTALAAWLKLDEREVRKFIKSKVLLNGKPRRGKKRLMWTREEAAICRWLLDHDDRFTGADVPEEESDD